MNLNAISSIASLFSAASASATASTTGASTAQAFQPPADGVLQPLPPMALSAESLARDTADFADKVGKMFRDNGISVPPEVILTTDYQGLVRVSNDHPDKAKIEALFASNRPLRDQFAKQSGDASLLRAVEGYADYARDYAALANNPSAQAARVYREIARNQASYSLAITAEGAHGFFTGQRFSA